MAQFQYKGTTPAGEVSEGLLEARDAAAALERVQALGLIPIRVAEAETIADSRNEGWFVRKRIKQDQVARITEKPGYRGVGEMDLASLGLIGLATLAIRLTGRRRAR